MELFKKFNTLALRFIVCFAIVVAGCSKKNPAEPENNKNITVTDIDDNVYQTVQIGNQIWMTENLKVTHYLNGDPIPNLADSTQWGSLKTGALCHYNNDETNSTLYGCLYNWYAVEDSRGIIPQGWHIPTDQEWIILEMTLGMSQTDVGNNGWRGTNEGSKLAGNSLLWEDGVTKNDAEFGKSGFTALPAGVRSIGLLTYVGQGNSTEFWSSTANGNVTARELSAYRSSIARGPKSKGNGLSIRCVKDN